MLYVPPGFMEDEPARLHALISQNSFATLISATAGEPWITHLPLLLQSERGDQGVLVGHLARANPHCQQFTARDDILAIFHGPHAYVSPALYQVHPSVPTWNYAVVHVHGSVRVIEEAAELEPMIRTMVDHYEQHREAPWQMALPSEYLGGMLRAIVGIEITITRMVGKFKLSQNRPAQDRRAVTASFETGDADQRAVAKWMRAGDL
jgi:transcriptional regulator